MIMSNGIYRTNDESHLNPGTPGTRLKVLQIEFRDSVPPYLQSVVSLDYVITLDDIITRVRDSVDDYDDESS